MSQAASQHSHELEAFRIQQQSRSQQDDRRLEQTRSQLTEAFQREMAIQQRHCEQLEQAAEDRLKESERLRAMLSERDDQVNFLTVKHQVRAISDITTDSLSVCLFFSFFLL